MREDLERFILAISWKRSEATEDIVCDYVETLISCFANLVKTTGGSGCDGAMSVLADIDESRLLECLLWPPFGRILLGRSAERLLPRSVSRPLDVLSVAHIPPVIHEVEWLNAELNKREWTPDRDIAASTLAAAYGLLSSCGSEIVNFVSQCTQVIIPVHSLGGTLGSWSSDELIGCTVLVNPHRINVAGVLAEQLVHEAVHHCQAMAECRRPFIKYPELSAQPERFQSPWTGTLLTAKSLLGACAVWFSIAHFWARARDYIEADIAEAALNRAVRGFEGPELRRYVSDFEWALDSGIVDLIELMRTEVLRQWRNDMAPCAQG
jgi:hypothetical protein